VAELATGTPNVQITERSAQQYPSMLLCVFDLALPDHPIAVNGCNTDDNSATSG